MLRSLLLAALVAAPFTALAEAQTRAATVRQGEAAVRQMPLTERPNRVGHFYGNTIRRRHYGTLFVNRMHSDRPVARFFYVPR